MGGWLSRFIEKEDDEKKTSKEIALVGCHGAGKSHFIECFEGTGCEIRSTEWFYKYTTSHNDIELCLTELGIKTIQSAKLLREFAKAQDCIYLFIDATASFESLFDSKQILLTTILELDTRSPICIILNIKSLGNRSFTFKDVERTLQLHILSKHRPILLVRLKYDSPVPVEYLFDWTIDHNKL